MPSEIDALRRVPTPFDERPLLVIWELTQACDLACVHCRADAQAGRDPLELSTEEGRALLDQIAEMGTPLVVLTGGDPAKRPDLVELVAYGHQRGLVMAVTPSATALMDGELVERLARAGLARIAVSLDAPDPETHDRFRGVDGSFAHTLRILAQAKELGLERQINTTLAPHNVDALDALASLANDVGVVLWSVFGLVPTGRAEEEQMLPPERLEAALVELAEISARVPFDIKTTAAPMYRRVVMERQLGPHARTPVGVMRDLAEDGTVRGPRGINDGTGMLFVSHRGEVYPSGFLPLSTGNVRAKSLASIYRTHPVLRALRDPARLTGKCGACPFKVVCGGSRARAFATTGDPHASDPSCVYVPRGFPAA